MIQKILAPLNYTVLTATIWKYIDRRPSSSPSVQLRSLGTVAK